MNAGPGRYGVRAALQLPALERGVVAQLLPRDAADTRSVVLEVRAGSGGDEAALFAADLLRMYSLFCAAQGWRFEVGSALHMLGIADACACTHMLTCK